MYLVFTLAGLACVGLPLAVGCDQYYNGYTQYGPAMAEKWSLTWLSLASLTAAVLLAVFSLCGYRARQAIGLHKNGIILYRPFRPPLLLHWQILSGVIFATTEDRWRDRPLYTRQHAWIRLHNGRRINLAHFSHPKDLPELVSRLKTRYYPYWLPQLQANLQAGQWLRFGPLAIHSQGLRVAPFGLDPLKGWRTQSWRWDQVNHMTIENGNLVIEFRPLARKEIPVTQIPNLEMLWQLLRTGIISPL